MLQGSQALPARQFYELRRYRIRVGYMRDTTRAYLKDALLPALGRLGLGPVGMFDVTTGEPPTAVVLIPHAIRGIGCRRRPSSRRRRGLREGRRAVLQRPG